MYKRQLWNGHRIHFDLPYAQEEEGYPGLVIAGPQIGDWMLQIVDEWMGEEGELLNITYSNRLASYIGETLTAEGTVLAVTDGVVELELAVKNENGDVVTPGTARVRLPA